MIHRQLPPPKLFPKHISFHLTCVFYAILWRTRLSGSSQAENPTAFSVMS